MVPSSISVSGGFCVLLALMLLLVPLPWLFAAVVAAGFHELCHYAAIRLCVGARCRPAFFAFSARLPLPPMSRGREMICALAGPVGGLCLLLLGGWMPRLALCAAMQSIYNLLPIYPLDGGRALRSAVLLVMKPPSAALLCGLLSVLCKLFLCLLGFYACFWLKLGIFPLLMTALLLIRVK